MRSLTAVLILALLGGSVTFAPHVEAVGPGTWDLTPACDPTAPTDSSMPEPQRSESDHAVGQGDPRLWLEASAAAGDCDQAGDDDGVGLTVPTAAVQPAVAPTATALGDDTPAALPRWRGGIDLYRRGVFSTQKTWYWCTAANAQIIRNIAMGTSNHSKAQQRRFFRYMRAHARYRIPLRHGVDPAGWAAGLRHFVDKRYRLVTSRSFKAALRSAVRNLRLTNLPVSVAVAHGNHAWVLTGFTATADPARTRDFRVTSVRVTGPLWGLQSRSYGYDMRPDTRLTRGQFKRFFTRWHYAPVRMAWEGRWVSVQPVP